MVKYASKYEKSSTDMSKILQSLVPINKSFEKLERYNKNEVPVCEKADDTLGPTIIRKLDLNYNFIYNKTQQEIFHCILQEALCQSDSSYIKLFVQVQW